MNGTEVSAACDSTTLGCRLAAFRQLVSDCRTLKASQAAAVIPAADLALNSQPANCHHPRRPRRACWIGRPWSPGFPGSQAQQPPKALL